MKPILSRAEQNKNPKQKFKDKMVIYKNALRDAFLISLHVA